MPRMDLDANFTIFFTADRYLKCGNWNGDRPLTPLHACA
jgi:hypothetical protein